MPTNAESATLHVEKLRSDSYNALVVSIRRCHSDLLILRVQPDQQIETLTAGQYTVLGLGYWEPRLEGCQPEDALEAGRKTLIKRAYSLSCPLLDDREQLVGLQDVDYLEFYIALVRQAQSPPALTPRIFALNAGDRIFCGAHLHGHYTLDPVAPDTDVLFAATGTGEAPHNAMLSSLLASGHQGRIVNLICVRRRDDLAYLDVHRCLEKRFPNYRYLVLTTREPENLDRSHPDYVGKRYLQEYFQSGDLERDAQVSLDPERTHVFLCGNPDMIGVPLRTHDATRRYPSPVGMVEVFERRGYQVDLPHHPGNIHFEKYW